MTGRRGGNAVVNREVNIIMAIGDILYCVDLLSRKTVEYKVEAFIVDENGIHPAYFNHDGCQMIGDCYDDKWFITSDAALKYLNDQK